MNKDLFQINLEDVTRRESALRTILQQMDIPALREDTTRHSNLQWINRNLRIQNADHPLFTTAAELTTWLLKWHHTH